MSEEPRIQQCGDTAHDLWLQPIQPKVTTLHWRNLASSPMKTIRMAQTGRKSP